MTSTENVDALMCTGPLDDAPTVEKVRLHVDNAHHV